MNPKDLRLLGLALRGGRLRVGLKAVLEPGEMFLLVLAADAGGNVLRNARRLHEEAGLPLLTLGHGKEELGRALGRTQCALAAVTDRALAAAIQAAAH